MAAVDGTVAITDHGWYECLLAQDRLDEINLRAQGLATHEHATQTVRPYPWERACASGRNVVPKP